MSFDGLLDDVLVFDVAISKEHIAYLAGKLDDEAENENLIAQGLYFVATAVQESLLGLARALAS
jgi:hypothetical protein